MKIKQLAERCKEIDDCDICENADECERLKEVLENISPVGLMNFVQSNGDI